MHKKLYLALSIGVFFSLMIHSQPVYACACCSEAGQRAEGYAPITEIGIALSDLKFGESAALARDYQDEERPELAVPSDYKVSVLQNDRQVAFDFRGSNGERGSLIFTKPNMYSYFVVDTLGKDDGKFGPPLYKELSFKSLLRATGIFESNAARGQSVELILQGTGLSCPNVLDYKRWMLIANGPKVRFKFIGNLEQ